MFTTEKGKEFVEAHTITRKMLQKNIDKWLEDFEKEETICMVVNGVKIYKNVLPKKYRKKRKENE